jgi:hypothetical protein
MGFELKSSKKKKKKKLEGRALGFNFF